MPSDLKIEIVLFNPPFGSPLARGSHLPQPSLIFDTGGKSLGDAMGIAHMLCASIWLTRPREANWRVHVDQEFTGLIIAGTGVPRTKRRVWIELQKGDSIEHAIAILKIVATREQPKQGTPRA